MLASSGGGLSSCGVILSVLSHCRNRSAQSDGGRTLKKALWLVLSMSAMTQAGPVMLAAGWVTMWFKCIRLGNSTSGDLDQASTMSDGKYLSSSLVAMPAGSVVM